MAAKLPFELVEHLPWDCDDDLAVFATAAMSHAWAGEGPKRVVITTDLVAAFKRYMPDRKFRDWSDRQQERYADTGGSNARSLAHCSRLASALGSISQGAALPRAREPDQV